MRIRASMGSARPAVTRRRSDRKSSAVYGSTLSKKSGSRDSTSGSSGSRARAVSNAISQQSAAEVRIAAPFRLGRLFEHDHPVGPFLAGGVGGGERGVPRSHDNSRQSQASQIRPWKYLHPVLYRVQEVDPSCHGFPLDATPDKMRARTAQKPNRNGRGSVGRNPQNAQTSMTNDTDKLQHILSGLASYFAGKRGLQAAWLFGSHNEGTQSPGQRYRRGGAPRARALSRCSCAIRSTGRHDGRHHCRAASERGRSRRAQRCSPPVCPSYRPRRPSRALLGPRSRACVFGGDVQLRAADVGPFLDRMARIKIGCACAMDLACRASDGACPTRRASPCVARACRQRRSVAPRPVAPQRRPVLAAGNLPDRD